MSLISLVPLLAAGTMALSLVATLVATFVAPVPAPVFLPIVMSNAGVVENPTGECWTDVAENERFGVNVTNFYGKSIADYDVGQLNAGWYLDYTATMDPAEPAGMCYVQLLWSVGNLEPDEARIHELVDANPGATWILGNEPDRDVYQDALTPEQYAIFYHNAYTMIKARDRSAAIATAGIVQPTPLRLQYLDRVLAEYQRRYGEPMPVDVWTIHNFTLREERDAWGAGIPPGMDADQGELYSIRDHGRMSIFQEHVVAFRQWMAQNGYRDRPLVVSEYGILLPAIYGFEEDVVEKFMLNSFDYLRTAADGAIGYPADDNRLVQAWAWYSLNGKEYDIETGDGFNGSLFDHDTAGIKSLGEAFATYVQPLTERLVHQADALAQVRPNAFIPTNVNTSKAVEVR